MLCAIVPQLRREGDTVMRNEEPMFVQASADRFWLRRPLPSRVSRDVYRR